MPRRNPDTSTWDTVALRIWPGCSSRQHQSDTSNWDTSNVTQMNAMFNDATAANPDTSSWNTSNVTNMSNMFNKATNAVPDTSGWDFGSVTTMNAIFADASLANPDVSGWNTGNVRISRMRSVERPAQRQVQPVGIQRMLRLCMQCLLGLLLPILIRAAGIRAMLPLWRACFTAPPMRIRATSSWDVSSVTAMDGMFLAPPLRNQI